MSRSPWYRLSLSAVLFISVFWLWYSRFDELAYHTWEKSELIDIGDALNFSEQRAKIPPNSYVSVSGVLGNKAASLKGLRSGSFRFGHYQVRHLLGSKLYIEYPESVYGRTYRPFMKVQLKGRLVSFGPDSELIKVRQFFKDYYNVKVDDSAMLIVVDEEPRSELIYLIFALLSVCVIILSFYFSLRSFNKPSNP
ncbi:MAG: hypothetical protein KC505_08005 [Myxococcales bacterium]|nr:hypothetical protein [Myxococcales bacterium]USN50983.1 MAG: hypothetical protein H6731_00790 [Myxococcales bacterium]